MARNRIEWFNNGGPVFTAENQFGPFALGVGYQIMMTIDKIADNSSNVCWYQDGGFRGCRTVSATLADLDAGSNYLGRSKYAADETASAIYNEVRIYDGALTANGARASFLAGPIGGAVDISIDVSGDSVVRKKGARFTSLQHQVSFADFRMRYR